MQMSFILTALIIHLSTSFRKAGYGREHEHLVCESRIISVCVFTLCLHQGSFPCLTLWVATSLLPVAGVKVVFLKMALYPRKA